MFDYWNNRDLGREAQRQDDRRTRERLEKQNPSGARVDFVGHLNAISHADASRQAPGLTALEDIRRRQRTAKVDAYGAQNPFRAQTAPTSNFDFSSRDPGTSRGAMALGRRERRRFALVSVCATRLARSPRTIAAPWIIGPAAKWATSVPSFYWMSRGN